MDTLAHRTLKRFGKAVAALARALELGRLPDNADHDAVLLRFELAAELMPKTLQRILSEQGVAPSLPKDIVRIACAAKIVDDASALTLLEIINDRNRMVHDYSEEYALDLMGRVRNAYAPILNILSQKLKEFDEKK